MGEKRVSTRRLKTGEQVHHHPPDAAHPEGKMVLIPGPSALKARLESLSEENQRRSQEVEDANLAVIEAKKARQRDRGLTPEKSGF